MKIHQLYRKQVLNISEAEAWSFFTSPYYLNEITPDFFHVEITSPVPDELYPGLLISYRMKAVAGLAMSWLSEISHCQKPRRFIYQQRIGPFHFWSHQVSLQAHSQGIVMEDIVFYAMPFSWFGEWMHELLIKRKLQQIFDTRRDYLQNKWGSDAR